MAVTSLGDADASGELPEFLSNLLSGEAVGVVDDIEIAVFCDLGVDQDASEWGDDAML